MKESCVMVMFPFTLYIYIYIISCTLFILCVFMREIKYGNGRWLGTRWGDRSFFWFNLPVKYSFWWKFIFVIYDAKIINCVLRKWCLGSILVEALMVDLAWESYSFVWFLESDNAMDTFVYEISHVKI